MPWQLSYAAISDSDNSELQTDVMRFMAILAFCLVAIFAIVQSVPLTPVEEPVPEIAQALTPVPTSRPVEQPETEVSLPRRQSRSIDPRPPAAEPATRPVAPVKTADQPPARTPKTTRLPPPVMQPAPPTVVAPAPPPTDKVTDPPAAAVGLSLRFESDAVLRSLAARGLVSLYAIDAGEYFRMIVADDRIGFGRSAAPAQYHEMIFETVPREVAQSFEAQMPVPARDVVWGVTLPAATTRQLMRFVETHFEGSLVITAEAGLALAGGS